MMQFICQHQILSRVLIHLAFYDFKTKIKICLHNGDFELGEFRDSECITGNSPAYVKPEINNIMYTVITLYIYMARNENHIINGKTTQK